MIYGPSDPQAEDGRHHWVKGRCRNCGLDADVVESRGVSVCRNSGYGEITGTGVFRLKVR